ncbi:MAG: Plug and carboxypeptidase regulatory-like domain-containing protein, partial [Acidobacteriota bacterium]|nr:Plug and carboxypeptidase regulatory-like domain-containing protein [Acidobacteriota bacterium]
MLHNVGTGRDYQTVSDSSGAYSLTFIPIGNYEVSAQAVGFKKATFTTFTLIVNDKRRVDFNLEVGQVTETLTVNADLALVNTANGTTSAVVTNEQLINLPSTARGVLPFALLMPGAVSTTPTSATANNTSVNGIRPTHNAWMLDGGYDIDTGGNWGVLLAPNMEIVEEVRAIRGNYSSEFGTGGGSQFNAITKSGTNQIHGSAYEFLRNSAMNARSYFQPTLPVLKNNEYGFTIGGPVVIPKLYNGRNRTFFFANIDWNPLRSQTQFLDKLPEAGYRNGDFSGLGKIITDPQTGAPFPGNMIPASRIDPNAAIYVKQYPTTNFRDSIGDNYAVNQPQIQNVHQYTARVDHNFSDKYRLMGRWTANHSDNNYFVATEPGYNFLRRDDIADVNHLVIDQTSSLRSNLINDFNFVRVHNRLEYFPNSLNPASGIKIPLYFPVTSQSYPLANLNLSAIPQRVPGISLVNYS